MLQHHAPRAWSKRLLLWQIFEGSLTAYFLKGSIIERRGPAGFLIDAQGEDGEISLGRVETHFSKEIAEALRAIGCAERPEPISSIFQMKGIEVGREEWAGEPRTMMIGPFIFADKLDFEAGILTLEDFSPRDLSEVLFGEEHEFLSEFDDSYLDADLREMCFEQSAIEMLAPGAPTAKPLTVGELYTQSLKPAGGPGRSRKWDWEGALAHIVSIANTPDGLPEGHGAQAAIERMMLDWFTSTANGAPQESEIRKRAAQVMSAVQGGRK